MQVDNLTLTIFYNLYYFYIVFLLGLFNDFNALSYSDCDISPLDKSWCNKI